MVEPVNGFVRPRRFGGMSKMLAGGTKQDIVHQGGFAGAAHSREAHELLQGNLHCQSLQIVRLGPCDAQGGRCLRFGVSGLVARRHFCHAVGWRWQQIADAALPVQILRGQIVLAAQQLLRSAHETYLATVLAGTGAYVDDQVRGQHDLRVMFNHHQSIAGVAQAVKDADHACHVARMQPDTRFIQNKQRIDERGAQRRGEIDALHLATGKCARLAIEGQVSQAHIEEKSETRADLCQQQLGRFIQCRPGLAGRVRQCREKCRAVFQGQSHHFVEGEPFSQGVEMPPLTLWLQARAVAGMALRVGAVFGQQHANVHLVGLAFEPLEKTAHTIPVPLAG